MSSSTRSALKALLAIMAVLVILGGLTALFATSWIVHFGAMHHLFSGTAVEIVLKFVGVLAVGLGYLLSQAARDPVRYVAVIDVFALVLIVGAILDVYAALTLELGPPALTGAVWGRAVLRLLIAGLVIAWRPGER